MRKLILFLFTLSFCVSGCSSQKWKAMFILSKAEELTLKAYELRVKPAEEARRQKLYVQACDEFYTAFRLEPKLFTLNRFSQAVDACTRAEKLEALTIMEAASVEYEAAHPTEAEQGDVFVGLE